MLTHELIPAAEADSKWLMVVLHGLGDSIEGYRWLPEAMGLPWLNYLLVNAPDDYHGGFSWYDIPGNPSPGVERSRTALFELLDAQREVGFAAEQIFQFGFSQGCLMTMEVAMRYPHRLAGCVGGERLFARTGAGDYRIIAGGEGAEHFVHAGYV